MTVEAIGRANEILSELKELREALGLLECRVYRREKDIEEHKEDRRNWIPIPNWFGRGSIKKNNKVNLDIPIEGLHHFEFEIDEECVRFIINHQREKIKMLEKELEEL